MTVSYQPLTTADCNTTPCEAVNPEYCYFPDAYNEYGQNLSGGQIFFRQNKPGSPWYDLVSNSKGWTVDFNLEVLRIENASFLSEIDSTEGVGIYVNDGIRQETIVFLEQEVLFKNANVQAVYDTTQPTQYRLIGRDQNIRLYGRREGSPNWKIIANVSNASPASNEGNAHRPSVYEDANGDLHSVWYDDGNGKGQLYYSKRSSTWSIP